MKCSDCDPDFYLNEGLVEVKTKFDCKSCGMTFKIEGVYFLTSPVVTTKTQAERVMELVESGERTAEVVECPPPPFWSDDHWG